MEPSSSTWEQKIQALTHILIHPTTTPTLHSQFLISSLIPNYRNWDFPPLSSPNPSLNFSFAISLFLKRVSRLGLSPSSWRAKCPYQQPPPLVLARGVEEAKWGDEDRKLYVRMRLRRKRVGSTVHPLIPFLLPNMFLLSLLLWDPYPSNTL